MWSLADYLTKCNVFIWPTEQRMWWKRQLFCCSWSSSSLINTHVTSKFGLEYYLEAQVAADPAAFPSCSAVDATIM